MHEKRRPHYDLCRVKRLSSQGQLATTRRVQLYLGSQRWDLQYVTRRVHDLSPDSFHKSQAHRDRSGAWLDIYRPLVDGRRLYVKFTIDDETVWFLSFCIDGDEH